MVFMKIVKMNKFLVPSNLTTKICKNEIILIITVNIIPQPNKLFSEQNQILFN